MRLGTSSPLAHSSPEEWAANQIGMGMRCVNFPLNCEAAEDKITAYRDAAVKNDLLIAEVGIWRNALAADPDERKKNIDYCVRQLRLADYLGARCAVNVAGAFGPRWDGHYKENFSHRAWEETASVIKQIIDTADVKKTYFTIEPMPWMIPTGPDEYLKLIDMVDRDRFAVHMDIINMTNSAQRYFNAEEFVDEVCEKLGTKIRSCHIKDVHLAEEYTFRLEECGPGDGEFPLSYYASKMSSLDPDMPVILEHLDTDEEYIKYMNYLKEVLNGIQ